MVVLRVGGEAQATSARRGAQGVRGVESVSVKTFKRQENIVQDEIPAFARIRLWFALSETHLLLKAK